MKINHSNATRFAPISMIILFTCLACDGAGAVTYTGVVTANWHNILTGGTATDNNFAFTGSFQPRIGADLTAVSAQVDVSGTGGASAVAAGAIYGTDSSRSQASPFDPDLVASGIGVEPMADIQLQAAGAVTSIDSAEYSVVASSAANLSVSVQHRIILNPVATIPNDILADVLAQLNNVPVNVLWRYNLQRSGNSTVDFNMTVSSPTGDCQNDSCGALVRSSQGPVPIQLLPNQGSISFFASATTASRDALFDIGILAVASVRASGEKDLAALQLAFDPFFTVDPNWIYADFFLAQQESTLNAGEWVGITRNYLGAPVPLPASVWLLGSALGLLGWMRRNRFR